MQKRIATDDDDVAMHATLDHHVAAKDDDALSVRGVARQHGWSARRHDDSMGGREHVGEAATERARSRIANDDLLSIHSGARNRADDEQRRDARAEPHRASSRKFLRSALPCWVITDSGWN